jgi:hypothetical protein
LLGITVPQAIGHLHMLWWWALDYAQDGDLSRYTDEDVADAVLWDGDAALLMSALREAGFLDQSAGDPPWIHDWSEYGGKLLTKRKSDADRKRSTGTPLDVQRNSTGTPLDVQRNSTGVPTDVQRRSQVDKRRVEESRGEDRTGEDPPAAGAADDDLPLDAREIRDLVISKLPPRYQRDPLTWEEAEQLGQDYAGQHTEVCVAIEECRRTPEKAGGGLPFPQRLRRFLPPPTATVQRFVESGLFSPTGVYVGKPVWEDEADAAAQSPAPQVAS